MILQNSADFLNVVLVFQYAVYILQFLSCINLSLLFSDFSRKTYVIGIYFRCLTESLLWNIHNMLCGKLKKKS